MKSLLFRRAPRYDTIAAVYEVIVAQARLPVFYQAYGVPDTVVGRLEMILLHMVLFWRRLRAADALRGLGQRVFDFFCSDMDGNLREMGVGDLGVPRHMRRIGEAFYGRAAAYEAALADADDDVLAECLRRNVFSGTGDAHRLAAYTRAAARHLAQQSEKGFAQGCVSFPDPGRITG